MAWFQTPEPASTLLPCLSLSFFFFIFSCHFYPQLGSFKNCLGDLRKASNPVWPVLIGSSLSDAIPPICGWGKSDSFIFHTEGHWVLLGHYLHVAAGLSISPRLVLEWRLILAESTEVVPLSHRVAGGIILVFWSLSSTAITLFPWASVTQDENEKC